MDLQLLTATPSWMSSMPRAQKLPPYVEAITAKGKTYFYFKMRGRRYGRLPGDPNSPEFYEAYAEFWRLYRNDPKRRVYDANTLGWVIGRYREHTAFTTLKPKTQASYERELRKLEPLLGARFADIRLQHLDEIYQAIAVKTPRTAQLFGQVCSKLWNHAIRHLYADVVNPAQKMGRVDSAEKFTAWTDAQMERFEASNPPRFLMTAYMIARYAGPRRADVLGLMWSSYDGTVLAIAGSKTNTPSKVLVHERLRVYLDALPRTSLYLVSADDGNPIKEDRLTHALRGHLDRIGLTGLSMHGLRHTAGKALAEAGCSPHEIAAVLGHKTLQMASHYAEQARRERLASAAIIKLEGRGKT